VDEEQLRAIASADTEQSPQHYFYADNFDQLQSVIAVLVNSVCLIIPTTPPPPTTTTTTTTTATSTTTTTIVAASSGQ